MPKDQRYSRSSTISTTQPTGTSYASRTNYSYVRTYGASSKASYPYIQTNPWSSYTKIVKIAFVSAVSLHDSRYGCSGPVCGDVYTPSISVLTSITMSPTYNSMLGRIRKDVDGAKIVAPVALAEARSTADMCTAVVAKTITALTHLGKRDFLGCAKALGLAQVPRKLRSKRAQKRTSFDDAWMEYRYGWTPLLSDVHEATKLACESSKDEGVTYSNRSSMTLSVFDGEFTKSGIGPTLQGLTLCKQYSYARVVDSCRAWWSFKLNSIMSGLNKYGLLNPAETAWELIPYSFVIDWFVNVGDVIGSLGTLGSVASFKGGIQVKRTSIVNVSHHVVSGTPPWWKSNTPIRLGDGSSLRLEYYSRTSLGSFPIPVLQPTVNPFAEHSSRIIDSAYLLSSVYNTASSIFSKKG